MTSQHNENFSIDPEAIVKMVGDDPEGHKRLWDMFVRLAPDMIQDILLAYQEQRIHDVRANSHKLKSSARGMGVYAMADLCEELEVKAKAEDWDGVHAARPERLTVMMGAVVDYVDQRA